MSTHALSVGSTVRIEAEGRRMNGCIGIAKYVGASHARVEFESAHSEWFALADVKEVPPISVANNPINSNSSERGE